MLFVIYLNVLIYYIFVGGKDVYSYEYVSISFFVMLSDIFCSLCDFI